MKEEIADQQVSMARRLTILAIAVWFAAELIAGVLGSVNQPGRPPLVLAGLVGILSWDSSRLI